MWIAIDKQRRAAGKHPAAVGLTEPATGRARWENPAAGRYYEAHLVRDLFGDWQVLRVWGGIGTAYGAVRFDPVAGPDAFPDKLSQIDKRRTQRGYFLRP